MASTGVYIDTDCKLLLHCNGADTSTTFTDSELNTAKTVTAVGNAQIDTAQSKFGGGSGLLDGTGDYLTVPDDADWFLSTGDFTVDFWIRFNTVTSGNYYQQFVDANNRVAFRRTGGGALQFFIISAGVTLANYTVAWSPSTATWYHLALVRNTTTLYMFVDGVSQSLTTLTGISTNAVPDLATQLEIGFTNGGVADLDGWIDEYRVVKGTAVWTATFTPSSAEYTAEPTSTTNYLKGRARNRFVFTGVSLG